MCVCVYVRNAIREKFELKMHVIYLCRIGLHYFCFCEKFDTDMVGPDLNDRVNKLTHLRQNKKSMATISFRMEWNIL